MLRYAIALLPFLSTAAMADLRVEFKDGAPKDRFTLTMDGGCALEAATVIIDLAPAPAGLIFDVTAAGAGVEVYQPFEAVRGNFRTPPTVRDGDQTLALTVDLTPGEDIAFTIDLDDTTSSRGITVSGAEIAGAEVRLGATTAVFGSNGVARLPLTDCLS